MGAGGDTMFHNKLFRLVRGRCSRQRGLLIGLALGLGLLVVVFMAIRVLFLVVLKLT